MDDIYNAKMEWFTKGMNTRKQLLTSLKLVLSKPENASDQFLTAVYQDIRNSSLSDEELISTATVKLKDNNYGFIVHNAEKLAEISACIQNPI